MTATSENHGSFRIDSLSPRARIDDTAVNQAMARATPNSMLRITTFALALGLAACGGTAVIDAGSEPGGGSGGAGGAAQGEDCGDVTCALGQVCCNESCSICAAPNEPCVTIACE
jgi:hypothetical protein